jgi:5-methylcytosine-specific restriction endonuclease McrA
MTTVKTLALNKSYIPIRILTPQEAICKFYAGSCEAIIVKDGVYNAFNFNDWLKLSTTNNWPAYQKFIMAVTQRIAIPLVIRYLRYDLIPKQTLRLSKKNIYTRDKYTCYICGKRFTEKQLSTDHIIPISRGGKNDWLNLITCCKKCNGEKGNMLLSEMRIKPKFLPFKPSSANIVRLKNENSYGYEEWKYFGI